MIIYLLRHGDAAENPSLHDSERPLSELGLQQASIVGQFLHLFNAQIDRVLTSPLMRAQQMAAGIQGEIGAVPISSTEHLSSSSDPKHVIAELNRAAAECILLVGHEPHLSSTISLLISGGTRCKLQMRKASLACIEAQRPVESGLGVLKWLLTVDQMRLVK